MTNPLLEVHDLDCLRNNSRLFSGLNFSLMPGEILQVTGHNGSGKTSLLKLLSGLLNFEYGQGVWDSDDLLYIGHKLGIKSALTVMENLSEIAVLYHVRGLESQLLKRLGLLDLIDRPCLYLSAGQRQRLALARLFFIKRKLWILDE